MSGGYYVPKVVTPLFYICLFWRVGLTEISLLKMTSNLKKLCMGTREETWSEWHKSVLLLAWSVLIIPFFFFFWMYLHFKSWIWKVKVAQLCLTLWDTMIYTVHRILQAKIPEWVAFLFSRGIFSTQESNRGLLHCRRILYQLSYQGSPISILVLNNSNVVIISSSLWQAIWQYLPKSINYTSENF